MRKYIDKLYKTLEKPSRKVLYDRWGISGEAAADAYQETWAVVWKKYTDWEAAQAIGSKNPPKPVPDLRQRKNWPWFFTILIRMAINRERIEGRIVERAKRWLERHKDDNPVDEEKAKRQKEYRLILIYDFVKRMHKGCREPLLLLYRKDNDGQEKKSMKQLADLFGITEQSMKNKLSRCRKKIQKYFESMDTELPEDWEPEFPDTLSQNENPTHMSHTHFSLEDIRAYLFQEMDAPQRTQFTTQLKTDTELRRMYQLAQALYLYNNHPTEIAALQEWDDNLPTPEELVIHKQDFLQAVATAAQARRRRMYGGMIAAGLLLLLIPAILFLTRPVAPEMYAYHPPALEEGFEPVSATEDVQSRYDIAVSLYQSGQYQGSIAKLEEIEQIFPYEIDSKAHRKLLLGMSFLQTQAYDQALEAFHQAEVRAKDSLKWQAIYYSMVAWNEKGDKPQALTKLNSILSQSSPQFIKQYKLEVWKRYLEE